MDVLGAQPIAIKDGMNDTHNGGCEAMPSC